MIFFFNLMKSQKSSEIVRNRQKTSDEVYISALEFIVYYFGHNLSPGRDNFILSTDYDYWHPGASSASSAKIIR